MAGKAAQPRRLCTTFLGALAALALGAIPGAASATQVTSIGCREGHLDGGFSTDERISQCIGTTPMINLGTQHFEFVRISFSGIIYSQMFIDYDGAISPSDGTLRPDPITISQWSPVAFGISGSTFLDDAPPLFKEGWSVTSQPYSTKPPYVASQSDSFLGIGPLAAGEDVQIYGERDVALTVEIPFDARIFQQDGERVIEFFAQYHFLDGNWWDFERRLITTVYDTGFEGVLTVEVVDEPPMLALLALGSVGLFIANRRRRCARCRV